ncbi:MAG: YqaE/Pmp3 family membrane protein [Sphingobacteriales bacterium]|nr:YqaE/Pmp3 family membrane protein [Sphingobacteriales bacterium]
MRYFICFLCPPLAVLSTGRPLTFILNLLLTLCFWIPGVIHAILIVNDHNEDRRTRRMMRAARRY